MAAAEFERGSVKMLRTKSSDISGYHAELHEEHGIVEAWQGRSIACAN